MIYALCEPTSVAEAKRARELLRAWIIDDGNVVFATRGGRFDDPAAYGIILADLLVHLVQNGDGDVDSVRSKVARAANAFSTTLDERRAE